MDDREADALSRRALVGAGMNLWAYLVNDLFDVDLDLAAPGRDVEAEKAEPQIEPAADAGMPAVGQATGDSVEQTHEYRGLSGTLAAGVGTAPGGVEGIEANPELRVRY